MLWDYTCPRCAQTEERQVPVAERDSQKCGVCHAPMQRAQAFARQKVWVPFYMRSSHDERTYIPADPAQRRKFLEGAYRAHGRWRTDLDAGDRPSRDMARHGDPPVGEAERVPAQSTRPDRPDLAKMRRPGGLKP